MVLLLGAELFERCCVTMRLFLRVHVFVRACARAFVCVWEGGGFAYHACLLATWLAGGLAGWPHVANSGLPKLSLCVFGVAVV